MDARTILSAFGVGVTIFLLVAVSIIELLAIEFSAIVGLPVGLLAGLGVFALLLLNYGNLDPVFRVTLDALAGFGFGVILLFGTVYVHFLEIPLQGIVGGAVGFAVIAGAWSWLADH